MSRLVQVEETTWLNPALIVAVLVHHQESEQYSKVSVYYSGGSKYGPIFTWDFTLSKDINSHPRADATAFAEELIAKLNGS